MSDINPTVSSHRFWQCLIPTSRHNNKSFIVDLVTATDQITWHNLQVNSSWTFLSPSTHSSHRTTCSLWKSIIFIYHNYIVLSWSSPRNIRCDLKGHNVYHFEWLSLWIWLDSVSHIEIPEIPRKQRKAEVSLFSWGSIFSLFSKMYLYSISAQILMWQDNVTTMGYVWWYNFIRILQFSPFFKNLARHPYISWFSFRRVSGSMRKLAAS